MKKIIILFCSVFILVFVLKSCISRKSSTGNQGKDTTTAIKSDTIASITKTPFFIDYYPTTTFGNLIKHTYYTLSYSEKDEQAEWVAYKLTPAFLNKIKRTNNFREDTLVTTGSATLADYKGSGYDRGHLAPAAAMSLNKTAMSESFFMSNMSPQKPGFNRGIWKHLESQVRKWALLNDSLFVVSGPILDYPIGRIGVNKVSIPRAYYKTIVGFKNGIVKGIAFLLPNKKAKKSIFFYATSIDSIETITGLNFYRNLADSIQTRIELNKEIGNGF